MKLHLGMNDVSYVGTEPKTKRGKTTGANITTGDVAQILEDEYHIMQTFFDKHQADIASDLESSVAGALESVLMGAPLELNAFGEAESAIQDRFQRFIDNKEMDGQPGVPTKASLLGVSKRFKNKKGSPGRPSFVDTGLYLSNFRSWISIDE